MNIFEQVLQVLAMTKSVEPSKKGVGVLEAAVNRMQEIFEAPQMKEETVERRRCFLHRFLKSIAFKRGQFLMNAPKLIDAFDDEAMEIFVLCFNNKVHHPVLGEMMIGAFSGGVDDAFWTIGDAFREIDAF